MDPRTVIEALDALMRVWDRNTSRHFDDRALVNRIKEVKVLLANLKRQRDAVDAERRGEDSVGDYGVSLMDDITDMQKAAIASMGISAQDMSDFYRRLIGPVKQMGQP